LLFGAGLIFTFEAFLLAGGWLSAIAKNYWFCFEQGN